MHVAKGVVGGRRRTGQRWREKWNAAPLRGLHGALGPGASPSPPVRRAGSFLGENHPQTRSPEGSLTPGPARPSPGAAAPPYPAVCRLLPALSDLLIFHLTRRFPSSPTPYPRLRPESRLGRGRQRAGFCSMNPAPFQARKRLQSKAQDHPGSHLGRGQRNQKVAIFLITPNASQIHCPLQCSSLGQMGIRVWPLSGWRNGSDRGKGFSPAARNGQLQRQQRLPNSWCLISALEHSRAKIDVRT